jgi:hypothetical protein
MGMTLASRLVPVALVVGVGGILALGVAHLALVDIRHGEVDVRQEWIALQVAVGVVLVSQVLALVALWGAFRSGAGRARDSGGPPLTLPNARPRGR